MKRRVIAAALALIGIALILRVSSGRRELPTPPPMLSGDALVRQSLFELLQPVSLANCTLERFGEANDGGYLLCGNLLGSVSAGYSYGISGYDGWGCDVSRKLGVTVHQYDCFDTRQPACPARTRFHAECIGETAGVIDGRPFDTLAHQLAKNGDTGSRRLVVKMDVEGAEWDSLLQTPDEVLDRIDQLAIEFHQVNEPRFLVTIQALRRLFYVAHLHFNNFACASGLEPFPASAYEALLVNKRIGVLGKAPAGARTDHSLDAPNNPKAPDCQAVARR